MQEAFREIRKTMMEQEAEELKLPAHLRMEYGHRHDSYARSIDPQAAELEIDLPTNLREGQGALNATEAEHLRMVVLGLVEKLKGMQILQGELKNTKIELDRSQAARTALQQSLDETMAQITAQQAKQSKQADNLIKERNDALDQLFQQQQLYKESLVEVDLVTNEFQKVKASVSGTQAVAAFAADQRAEIDTLL